MAFNGSGTFVINSAGQPVVYNTIIDETVFNALTADLATGLSTCITKDGQTTPTANIPMGGYKITGLGLGTASTDAARIDNANSLHTCEFRLTLTTGLPVTTSDVNGASTLYFTPYKGNRIALYDGSNWYMRSSSQLSLAAAGLTASKPYDIFIYDNAGTPTIEALVWTDDTNRATALTTQDGVLVKTGATTRRYVGTVYVDGSTQFNDSFAKRHVWNYHHRSLRVMRVLQTADSYNYSTATIRQANGSTANQLDMVIGVSEDAVEARIEILAAETGGATTGTLAYVGVGVDSTTAFTTGNVMNPPSFTGSNVAYNITAAWRGWPGAGRHYLAWNERGGGVGTTTWYGDNGVPTLTQAGIHGLILA